MSNIKEASTKKEVNSYLTGDHGDVVTLMEQEWPLMLINISVGTQLQTEDEVHLSLTGLWFRMNDKIQRLKNLLMSGRKNAVEGEPIEDAFLDVSNYGIMATIVKNGKWGK